MIENIKKKYPVNRQGMAVIPCVSLTAENIEEWMIGLRVTIGLSEPGVSTDQGILEGYDDKSMWVRVGAKRKKFPYDPKDIQLCVYQFDSRILFSNEPFSPPKKKQTEEEVDIEEEKPQNEKPNVEVIKKKPSNPKSLFGM